MCNIYDGVSCVRRMARPCSRMLAFDGMTRHDARHMFYSVSRGMEKIGLAWQRIVNAEVRMYSGTN